MNGSQSLAALCAVCYAEQPKYRCPRCKCQTCSLPCYKKHQQRSACNGVRDPAAFVKKSKWATPAGIDHDYNFLKSVEKQIERATDDVKSKTIPDGASRKHNKQQDSPLQRYLTEHNIDLIRAPAGMSRSRLNKTRVTGGGKVVWTIEWVDGTGGSYLSDDNSATCKISELHTWACNKRAKASRQEPRSMTTPEERRAKRPRIEDVTSTKPQADTADQISSDEAKIGPKAKTSSNDNSDTQFYYLKAVSQGKDTTVLIPIEAQDSLTTALSNHAVQEYPIILVLPFAASDLPAGYVTEETFLGTQESLVDIKQVAVPAMASSKPLDANQILDMLRRDVHTT